MIHSERMQDIYQEFEITDDQSRLDFAVIHGWLTGTYWSPGISRGKVEQAAKYSALVIGAYLGGRQAGYCRVVSDRTRFAWLADVYVGPEHRGRGLGQAIVRFALEHPDLADVHNWLLGTLDAHGVYAKLGFAAPREPQRLMQLWRKQVL
jgi:GNAT superfamily N-acetyltransferase